MKNIKCSTTLALYVLYLVNIVHVFCTDILQNNLSPTYRCLIFFTNTIENNALGDSKLACVSESYGEVEGLSQFSTTMIGKEVLEMENRAATCMLSPPGKMRCSHGSDRIRRNTVVSKRCPLRPQHQVEAVKASAAFGCSEEVGDQKLYFSSTRWNSSCSTRGTFRRRLPGSFASPRILDGLLRVSAMLVCLSALGEGLVILEPFQTTFQHVPADFGPNVLTVEPPIESRPLVGARPRDACAPLRNRWQMARGAIALIERGNCNFTEKVRNAQSAGASAVVVTDNNTENTSHKTMTTMSGEPEYTRDVNIPSVLVTYTDGQRLWARRSRWSGGDRIVASVNAKGHLRPPTIGALETLGVYILVSMILIGFSVICGVVVALAVSWYQRGYRARAMRRLKTFVFERSVGCSANGRSSVTGDASGAQAAAFSTTPRQNSTEAAAAESQDPAPRRQQDGADAGGGAAEKSGEGCNGLQAGDDMCAICLELYEVGDKLTALPCHHSFHTDCIKPWLSGKSGVCPMCKREAFSPRGKFLSSMAPRIEATLEELRALCTDNLLVLGVFFLASVACGVVAANMSVRD